MNCKLLTQDLTSHGGFAWELGKAYALPGAGTELCSGDVFHYYAHPVLAVLFNPIHADIANPRLFACDVVEVASDGLKYGTKTMALTQELDLPQLATEQRVEFAIRVALRAYNDEGFVKWAQGWLDGSDRSEASARAAWAAAWAARAAARAAETTTPHAAHQLFMDVLNEMNLLTT